MRSEVARIIPRSYRLVSKRVTVSRDEQIICAISSCVKVLVMVTVCDVVVPDCSHQFSNNLASLAIAVCGSSSDLARLLNLSTRRVQQLVKAGLLPTPGPQGHRIVEAVRAYLRVLQQPTRTANLSEARQKLIEVQTQIRQVELEEKHGRW